MSLSEEEEVETSMGQRLRWILVPAVLAVALSFFVWTAVAAPKAGGKKFTIALSNSFIGNKWRIEMENDFKSACATKPYTTAVTCSVYNSGNDVSKQTQQISNLVSQHVDAILVDAASGTGLNGIIGQACARGILVVAYDNLVTAPCAIKINGTVVDINDPNTNNGIWVVSRNGRRAVLTIPVGLTLDDKVVVTGAQVSHKVAVVADLLTAPDAALPDWARISAESGSRGPS